MLIGIDASRAFSPQRTGTENYSYYLIKALAKIDNNNTYRLYSRGVTKEQIDFTLPKNFSVRNISWGRFWTQGGLALETIKNPPDILFIPAHTLPLVRELFNNKTKTVVVIHDLGFEYLPNYHQMGSFLYLNRSTEWAVKWADALIAVSEATRDDLIKKMHCDPKKIDVIHEGVDLGKFQIKSEQYKNIGHIKEEAYLKKTYDVGSTYILYVGTIQPRKNLSRLIEAFSLVYKLLSKHNCQLIIVGKPGWRCDEIYSAPNKYGIEGRVKFLNYVPDGHLPMLYRHAMVFCLPSLFEGFGLPVLEAMASGCPVITSNVSSLPEIVDKAAILVDPLSSTSIASAIRRLLDDDVLRYNLIDRGRSWVKKFNWEETARETIRLFEDLIKS